MADWLSLNCSLASDQTEYTTPPKNEPGRDYVGERQRWSGFSIESHPAPTGLWQ